MRQRFMIGPTGLLCVALAGATAMCAVAEDESFEEHHSHEHGVATLDVAVQGSQLVLQFRSPAMNLLGFEHAPRSPQDDTAVSRALKWLRSPAAQFKPSADARCEVTKFEVVPPQWERSTEHAEFSANYEFSCEHPPALEHLQVRLLEQLVPDVKLEVQVASSAGQYSAELTRSKARLALRPSQK